MSTQLGSGNDYASCRKDNSNGAQSVAIHYGRSHCILAVALSLVLWLAAFDAAGAASGTPWHTQSDSLAGEALQVWELWSSALDAEKWADDHQPWVDADLPWLIALHPTTAASALATSSHGVHLTHDGGESWTHLLGIIDPVIALAYNAQDTQTVYAGTELAGTYRSDDGGLYWRRINTGFPRDRLGHVAGAVHLFADPALSGTLFAATTTAAGLYRTQNNGATWHLANSGLPQESILGLAGAASGSARLYAVTASGLYLSTDRAQSWSQIGTPPTENARKLLLEPGALGNLLLVAERAIYRSTNAGITWVELDIPQEMAPIRDAALRMGSERTLLLVAGESGPYWQWLTPATPQSPPPEESAAAVYVAVTGHTIREPFLSFFNANGGVGRFGFPRTDTISEDGKTVQYFQRSRLEIAADGEGERVVQSPLGRALRAGGDLSAIDAQASSSDSQAQYAVDQVFASFYAGNNGREAFGIPLAPAAEEVQVNGVTLFTQYFEFARLEYHPGAESPVLLGLIGDEYLMQRGWLE